MKVAVLGANGFVGTQLCASLQAIGMSITPLDRLATAKLLALNIDLRPKFDWIVNCAGSTSELTESNVNLPSRMHRELQSCITTGFLHVSSVAAAKSSTDKTGTIDEAVQVSPDTEYGKSKLAGEEKLLASRNDDLKLCILRPPILYGAQAGGVFALLNKAAKYGVPLPLKNLGNERNFMFVGNFAAAVNSALLAELDGTYFVVDHPPCRVGEFYDALCHAHGHGRRSFSLGTITRPLISIALGDRATSLTANSCYSDTKFRNETGFQPPLNLEAALKCCVV